MKKAITLFALVFSCSLAFAQTPLPYFTDFETTAQRAGWTQYTRGNVSTYLWTLGNSGLTSSPTQLMSPSMEFANSTDTAIQWYVSPGFNFHTGGRVDSFSIFVMEPSQMTVTDSIILYLLQGSPDPSLATSKRRLANLNGMVQGLSGTMRDTGHFIIPPTSGTSYIAFKFYSTNDWFTVTIDSIYISGNSLTQIQNPNEDRSQFSVYPNPADAMVEVAFTNATLVNKTVCIIDAIGREVASQSIPCGTLSTNISTNQLPSGFYYLKIVSEGSEMEVRKLEIRR